MASPSDVADACVFFASPFASYVTGATLHGGGDRPAFLEALRSAILISVRSGSVPFEA